MAPSRLVPTALFRCVHPSLRWLRLAALRGPGVAICGILEAEVVRIPSMRGLAIPIAVMSMLSVGCGGSTSSNSASPEPDPDNVSGGTGGEAAADEAGAGGVGEPLPGGSAGQDGGTGSPWRPVNGLPDGPFKSDLAIELPRGRSPR